MTSEPAANRPPSQPSRDAGKVVPLRRDAGASAACPLAKCDGTGWIDADDGAVEPCECRSVTRTRSRARGLASAIPARYRGVSFDRPPLSDMARAPETRHALAAVREYADDVDARLDRGDSLWLSGNVGTGKTTLAMAVSAAAAKAGRSVAIYSLPQLLARIRRTYDADGRRGLLRGVLRAARLGRPPPHRRPRRREADRLGARAALRDRRRALRRRALDAGHHQSRGDRARGADRRRARSPAWSRCAATSARCASRAATTATRHDRGLARPRRHNPPPCQESS